MVVENTIIIEAVKWCVGIKGMAEAHCHARVEVPNPTRIVIYFRISE